MSGLNLPESKPGPNCRYVDIALNGDKYGTVLLENPKGHVIVGTQCAKEYGKKILSF